MPEAFEACQKARGRIRTISGPSKQFGLKAGQYMHVCFQGKKMAKGEVKTEEKKS